MASRSASASAICPATQCASWYSLPRPDDADVAAGAAHRDQRLGRALLVVLHAADRRLEDLGPRAEVPAQHDLGVTGMTLGEAQDVLRVRMPPPMDQLVVISHHAQVPVRSREQIDQASPGRGWCPGTRRPGSSASAGEARSAGAGARPAAAPRTRAGHRSPSRSSAGAPPRSPATRPRSAARAGLAADRS